MNSEQWDRIDLTVKRAISYTRSAEAKLGLFKIAPPSYWTLLDQSIETATSIVETLPDDYFEETDVPDLFGLGVTRHNMSDETLERAEKLVAAILARRDRERTLRRIRALENTTGRTPEETAEYQRKADELRSKT